MTTQKNDLNISFERSCRCYLFDSDFEWNEEKGIYADPRTQIKFVIFREGYNAAHKGL